MKVGEKKTTKGLAGLLIWLGAVAALCLLFRLFTGNRAVMNAVAGAALWAKQLTARALNLFPFSVGELLCAGAIVFALVFLVLTVIRAVKRREGRGLYLLKRGLLLASIAATLYLLLCVNLGASYYADGFCEKSGLSPADATVEELYALCESFTDTVNEYAPLVPRDGDGVFAVSRKDILASSDHIYHGAEALYPFLTMRPVRAKPLLTSRFMSATGYTGIYFPYTGEANVNTDFPASQLPATVAHELAHQRGVAGEDEANFVGILACLTSGDDVYAYSGALSAWVYLTNALYDYDTDAYFELWGRLDGGAAADLRDASAYWAQFKSPVSEAGEAVYDTFLKSYGQSSGVYSYNEVVGLLLAYYAQ